MAFDAHDYKNRNVVERALNHLKNWRGLATGYSPLRPCGVALVALASPGETSEMAVPPMTTAPATATS